MAKNSIKLDLLERILSEPCERKIAEASLDAFQELVAGDHYSATHYDFKSGAIEIFHPGAGWLGAAHALTSACGNFFFDYPTNADFFRKRRSAAYLRSELIPTRQWQRGEIYNEVDRHLGVKDMAAIYQITPSGGVMILTCGRDRQFRAKDVEQVRKFQRVLNALPPFHARRLPAPPPMGGAVARFGGLTAREQEVLHWVRKGKRNSEIAIILNISHHTVRHHLEKVFAKTGAETRTAAAHAA